MSGRAPATRRHGRSTVARIVNASSLSCREGHVPTRHGRVWFRVAGEGTAGTPLLLVHGGPGLPSDYLEPLFALADERPVATYDQLGCGRSDRPTDPRLWTVEFFLGELWKVRQALGFPRLHVWGHSWGSMLAVEYALTHPEGVASWTFSDPALSIPRWQADLDRYRRDLPPEVQAALDRHEAAGTTSDTAYGEATRVFYDRHFCRIHPWPEPVERAMAGYSDEVYRRMWGPSELCMTGVLRDYDRSGRLGEIEGPVLFLCGEHDEATPETTAWYRSLVPGAEMAVIAGASHLPWIENPGPYLDVLRDFLRRMDRSYRNRRGVTDDRGP